MTWLITDSELWDKGYKKDKKRIVSKTGDIIADVVDRDPVRRAYIVCRPRLRLFWSFVHKAKKTGEATRLYGVELLYIWGIK